MRVNVIKNYIETICNQLAWLKRERARLVNKNIGLFPNVEKSELKNYTLSYANKFPSPSKEQSDILKKLSIVNIRISNAEYILGHVQSITGSYLLSCIFKY